MPSVKEKEIRSKKASLVNVWIPHEHNQVLTEAATKVCQLGSRPNKAAFVREACIREAYRVTGKPLPDVNAS